MTIDEVKEETQKVIDDHSDYIQIAWAAGKTTAQIATTLGVSATVITLVLKVLRLT